MLDYPVCSESLESGGETSGDAGSHAGAESSVTACDDSGNPCTSGDSTENVASGGIASNGTGVASSLTDPVSHRTSTRWKREEHDSCDEKSEDSVHGGKTG